MVTIFACGTIRKILGLAIAAAKSDLFPINKAISLKILEIIYTKTSGCKHLILLARTIEYIGQLLVGLIAL